MDNEQDTFTQAKIMSFIMVGCWPMITQSYVVFFFNSGIFYKNYKIHEAHMMN